MNPAETILITGGTGTIGRALTDALIQKNYKIIILTRDPAKYTPKDPNITYAAWDINKHSINETAIQNADHIIHLAGAGIADKRWTKKRKQEIVSSRVKSSKLICDSLTKIPNKVRTVISASAIGWYGPDGLSADKKKSRHEFEETDPPAEDFLGQTCREWEASIDPVSKMGKRLIKIRTGIVLSAEGGALTEFLKPLRFRFATILGNGKQIISWIHIEDLVRIYLGAIEDEKFQGIYNAVSPQPVSNKELVISLANAKRGNQYMTIHVPSMILKIVLGEMSVEVLKSCTVSCRKLHIEGFVFNYPAIEEAFKAMFVNKD